METFFFGASSSSSESSSFLTFTPREARVDTPRFSSFSTVDDRDLFVSALVLVSDLKIKVYY